MLRRLKARSTPIDPTLPLPAKVCVALLVLMGVAALPSGWGLMHPEADGSALGMSVQWLEGTPFDSYIIPGVILFSLFGLGAIATAVVALLRQWPAPYLAFAIGVGLVIWIIVQVSTLRMFFFLQPVMLAWGAVLAILAYLWWRRWWRPA